MKKSQSWLLLSLNLNTADEETDLKSIALVTPDENSMLFFIMGNSGLKIRNRSSLVLSSLFFMRVFVKQLG